VNEINDDRIQELMTRVLAEEASAQDRAILDSWLSQSERNRQQFESYRRIFTASTRHYKEAESLTINADHEWKYFQEKMNTTKRVTTPTSGGNWWKMAAAILVLVVSGLLINYLIYKNDLLYESGSTITTVILPDSSKVILNRLSSILHKPSFNEEKRLVELEGEAFFDIKPDQTKPFIIETQHGVVEVTGTSFTVSAYDSLDRVEVSVQSGTVNFSIPAINETVKLSAGQTANYQDGGERIETATNKDRNFYAWSTRELVFENTPLTEVLATLGKVYNVTFAGTEGISAECVVTVSFRNQSLESVLNVLESTLGVTFTVDGSRVTITGVGC
jgi:transmembrane sensor